jgi:hypothetical protein
MQRKQLQQMIVTVTTVVLFTACGGGSNTLEGFDGNSFEKIAISQTCTPSDAVDEYFTLNSGDRVMKESEGTEVSIFHDENSLKKICLNSGSAYVIRAYQ